MTHDDVRQVGYDDADAQLLVDLVQQEYVRRYGGPDDSPLDPAEFRPPDGQFVVGYDNGRPVAMGGWRLSEAARSELGFRGRVVELRRMYVVPESRGRGMARKVLNHLEATAAAAGAEASPISAAMTMSAMRCDMEVLFSCSMGDRWTISIKITHQASRRSCVQPRVVEYSTLTASICRGAPPWHGSV
jgi:GNAT superfamily N-acetyltransferase